jgi:hypothetical protein
MISLNDYLNALDTAMAAGGGNFSAALFKELPLSGPTPDELIRFLAKLKSAVSIEWRKNFTVPGSLAKDANQVAKRIAAIGKIEEFANAVSTPITFTNIDKSVFAFQLALRVRSPRLINQRDTTLCGPVALVYDVAKRDPERYVNLAISLFTVGSGTFGAVQIKPSAKIRNGYKGLLPEADYVVLASVRDTDAIVMSSDLLRNIFTLTKPGALGEFLVRAGYKDVQDHTFLNLSAKSKVLNAVTSFHLNAPNSDALGKDIKNLVKAEQELKAGRFVVMNAEAVVSKSLMNGFSANLPPRTDTLPADKTHWTAVRKLKIEGNQVAIKIITWGGSYEGELEKGALLSRYAGYMSAEP